MQTEAALGEEVGTQTRKALAKKIKALKKRTDKLEPEIKSLNRSPSPPKDADASAKKPRRKKRRSVSPRYINERLQIRAPSPRRRLPWESPTTEEDADDGYTSLDLLPAVPPQPQNSAASLADPDDVSAAHALLILLVMDVLLLGFYQCMIGSRKLSCL